MSTQVLIEGSFEELSNDITQLIFNDPELITDPTNVDDLHDKLTQMIFSRPELKASGYEVQIKEPLTGGSYQINVKIAQ